MATRWLFLLIPLTIGFVTTDAWSQQQTVQNLRRVPTEARAAVGRPDRTSRFERQTRTGNVSARPIGDDACNLPSSGCTNDKRDSN